MGKKTTGSENRPSALKILYTDMVVTQFSSESQDLLSKENTIILS